MLKANIAQRGSELSSRGIPSVGKTLFINSVVCSLVGLFLWWAVDYFSAQSFWITWTYSQCIGLSLCLLFIGWSKYKQTRPVLSLWLNMVVFLAIVTLGFSVGVTVADMIFGHPLTIMNRESFFTISFFIALAVSLVSNAFYQAQDRLATLKLRSIEEKQKASEAQLSMLKAQVEPHMLFNTLANLRVLIRKEPEKAQALLDHLIDFLRATLEGSRTELTSVQDEFSVIENYLSLMKMRFSDRLQYELQIDGDAANQALPCLIVQPLVENAIKHGIETNEQGGVIKILAQIHQNRLSVSVSNTGSLSPPTGESTGFGLTSIR